MNVLLFWRKTALKLLNSSFTRSQNAPVKPSDGYQINFNAELKNIINILRNSFETFQETASELEKVENSFKF